MIRTLSVVATLVLCGCTTTKEYAPVAIGPIQASVPNQQRLLSSSAQDAVSQAAQKLQLSRYAGMSVRVEVVGVGVTENDILAYVRAQVESMAMMSGLRVLPPSRYGLRPVLLADASRALSQPMHSTSGMNSNLGTAAMPSQATSASDQSPTAKPSVAPPSVTDAAPPMASAVESADLRLVAAVDWGGIDIRDKKHTQAWPLAGQIGLGSLGVIVSLAGTGSDSSEIAVLGGAMVVGAAIWYFAGPDHTAHIYTLAGKVRVTMHVLPQLSGVGGLTASGEGESSIVVDSTKENGYTVFMPVPPLK